MTTNVLTRPRTGPWVFGLAIGVIGAAGWIVTLPFLHAASPTPWSWQLVIGLFVVGRAIRVELHASRTATFSFVMTDLSFVIALLLGEPVTIPIGLALGAGVVAVIQRPPPVKLVFNLAQELVGALLGMWVFTILRGDDHLSARTGLGAMAGGLAMGLFSHFAVGVVTRLATGHRQQAPLRALWTSTVGSLGNSCVAVQTVYLGMQSPWLVVVPLVFVVVLWSVYDGLRRQQRLSDRSELLYRATAALHEQPNIDDGLLSVLAELRIALRARWARIVLLTSEGAFTCAVDEDGAEGVAMTAATDAEQHAARRLIDAVQTVRLFPANQPDVTSGALATFATGDAVVAPVHRGDEAAGIVVVDARAGSVDRLTRADVDMVEMMTKQIGMALERGYLERSLHQLVELERQLTQQAFYDSVTGLVNRNYLMRELAALCTDQYGSHAVLLVDLDDFKMVNDSLGHVAGDELLKIVAQRLVGSIGDRGVVGRLGGDEFAIVLRNTDDEFCNRTAQHIISALAQVAHLEGREVSVGGSVGVRRTTGPPDEPATILRDADLALYDAKAMGKGRVAHFEPAMHELAQERLALTSALALAIEREEFVLVYQPIFDMINRRVSAAEALVRWMHPERGQLGPASFLQLCEESGWIVEVGWCVLREALQQLADWEPMLAGTEFYLSVNVSARQLREPHFAEDVLALLRTYNVPGHRLVLEITESLFIDDPIQTQQVLERMATAGLRFGLDDFGTGYSSLSQLQRLPLYLVKIDQSFVARLGTGTEATVFVRAIIQLADALRLQVVAEGVETVGQADELVRLGCRRGQGWLYARATSARDLTAMLDARAGQLAHEA